MDISLPTRANAASRRDAGFSQICAANARAQPAAGASRPQPADGLLPDARAVLNDPFSSRTSISRATLILVYVLFIRGRPAGSIGPDPSGEAGDERCKGRACRGASLLHRLPALPEFV